MILSGDTAMMNGLIADGIAKQKLHIMLLVDTSRSMQGERIGQVNTAIADIHKYLVDLQGENTNVDFYMSVLTFANEARFLEGYKGVNVSEMTPPKLKAIGYSNLHLAYEELAVALHKETSGGIMPDFGGVAPIILLLTDGHPTKSTEKQLDELKKLSWYRVALRYGISIGLHDDRTVRELTDFTEDSECVIECIDSSSLARIIRVIVLTASKVKSQSSAVKSVAAQKNQNSSNSCAHMAVKQQIQSSLEEVDDWEW